MRLTRQISVCLAVGAVVTFLTVGLTIAWMAREHDAEAERSTRTMVVGGLETLHQRLQALTNDYAWWDEAYQAYHRGDREWIDANIGTGITGTQIADALVVVSPQGNIDYGWAVEDGSVGGIFSPNAIRSALTAAEDAPVTQSQARTILVRGEDGIALVGIARIVPASTVDTADRASMPFVAMAQYLSDERLGELGRSFLLQDLSIHETPISGQDSLPLLNEYNRPIAYLTWTPPTPGAALLRMAAPPLIAALGIFSVAMMLIGFRAQTLANALFRSEQDASVSARRDHLTGLINRFGLNEILASHTYVQASAKGELAVIFLDINGFKEVNDSVGHHGGDLLVCEIARRVGAALPKSARLARVGGDEFVVVLHGPDALDVSKISASLPEAMDAPFSVLGMEFHIACAIGYTSTSRGSVPVDELIRQADMAMYQAKSSRQRDPVAYLPSMETGTLERKQFEGRLWHALQDGELSVAYQPIASSHDLSPNGLEALIRWYSPELGHVSPAKLVEVAEESGLIRDIGDFVLNRVCADMHRWPGLRVSVNVSPAQLRDPNYITSFTETLARYNVDPRQIEIELTENVMVGDMIPTARKLSQLRRLGVTVALDDFGTGFSSIGSLRNFPFDRVKIDRSFIMDITTNPDSAALVRALVAVADAMNLDVVAEGVETNEQAQLARISGCEYLQGYLLARPMSAEQMEKHLAESLTFAAAKKAPSNRRLSQIG